MNKIKIEISGRKSSSSFSPFIEEFSANHGGTFTSALKIINEVANLIKLQNKSRGQVIGWALVEK